MSDFNQNCSVIGAGVIGLMTAWLLSKRGYKVTVYDQAGAFSGSSWAGGGIISPVPPWGYPPAVNKLVINSLSAYPSMLAELQQISGVDSEFISDGLLYLGPFDANSEQWRKTHVNAIDIGQLCDWLPGSPALPVWWFKSVAQVRNPRLGQSLLKAVIKQGVCVHQHAPVRRLLTQNQRVIAIELDSKEQIYCDQVVLAAGAWSDSILTNSGLPILGVKPLRGQMLLWKGPPGLLAHMVTGGGKYLIPRRDGHILGGSTVEDVGFDETCTDRAQNEIQTTCQTMFPAITELPLIQKWSGLRPAIDREVPVIGPMPGITGLWLNTGHFRNGLGMAPASAQLLCDQLSGDVPAIDAQPYSVASI